MNRLQILPALLLVVLATACGDATKVTDPGAQPGSRFDGEYVSGGLPEPFGEGFEVRLTLKGDTLGFHAACNHFSGELTWEGDTMRAGTLGGTEMACEEEPEALDAFLADFFGAGPTARREGDDLALTANGETIRFVPAAAAAAPDVALEGTQWTLNGITEQDGDDGSVMVIPDDVRAGLRFDGERALVEDGCNTVRYDVLQTEDRIEFTNGVSTRRACRGAAASISKPMLAVLSTPLSWSISASTLRLENAKGKGLSFYAR